MGSVRSLPPGGSTAPALLCGGFSGGGSCQAPGGGLDVQVGAVFPRQKRGPSPRGLSWVRRWRWPRGCGGSMGAWVGSAASADRSPSFRSRPPPCPGTTRPGGPGLPRAPHAPKGAPPRQMHILFTFPAPKGHVPLILATSWGQSALEEKVRRCQNGSLSCHTSCSPLQRPPLPWSPRPPLRGASPRRHPGFWKPQRQQRTVPGSPAGASAPGRPPLPTRDLPEPSRCGRPGALASPPLCAGCSAP